MGFKMTTDRVTFNSLLLILHMTTKMGYSIEM